MRFVLVAVAAAAVTAFAGTGCPGAAGQCPALAELCPDLQCDGGSFKQGDDGCSICECTDAAPAVCWDDSECGAGERCDSVTFCERAPNCTADGPCPDACYGRCVAGSASCASDADCAEGQICGALTGVDDGGNARPGGGADGSSGGDAVAPPAPTGVCIDVSCTNGDAVTLPECPPGSEVGIDVAIDPCNPVCIQVDPCRALTSDQCAVTPGCQLLAEPCVCADGTANCDCAAVERCAAVDDCSVLGPDTCESNPNCVLVAVGAGAGSGGTGGGGAPAPGCDPSTDPNCNGDVAPPPPPDEQLVCVPRGGNTSGCFSDADCLAGETCTLTTVCGSGCETNADGSQTCFDECWSEQGLCTPSDTSCASLTPDQCANDPRCTLVDGTAPGVPCQCDPNSGAPCNCDAEPTPTQSCVPVSSSCTSDSECLAGQHCEVVESCPVCDPSGTDINCAAPCFAAGTCVDGVPPPINCSTDADCGAGGACVAVTVCTTCSDQQPPNGGTGGQDPAPPPPCDPACRDENVCVQTEATCFADSDCGAGDFCDLSGCLVAQQCPGVCQPINPPTSCNTDGDCAPGQRCATELASGPICVDDTASSGTFCSDASQCPADANGVAATCRFHPDVCPVDPNTGACDGWCVSVCADVVTSAQDPATGQCVTFQDSCIPPGWVTTDRCP